MKRKEKEKTKRQEIRRYGLFQNYRYAFRWLGRILGAASFAVLGADIVIEIAAPFLAMALPSAITAFFTSRRQPLEILFLVLLYVALLQAARIAMGWLKQERIYTLFLFRVCSGQDLYRKCVEADYQFFESAAGQKKMMAAEENIFYGNDRGVEAFITAFVEEMVNFGGLLLYSIIIGRKSAAMLLFLAAVTVLVALANYWAGERGYKIMVEYEEGHQEFAYLRREMIASANGKDIRLYRMKKWFLGALNRVSERLVRLRGRELTGYFLAGMLEKAVSFLRDAVIYGILIYQMAQGTMNLSSFLLYVGVVSGFGGFMTGFFTAVSKMLQNNRTMDAYRDFLDSGIVDGQADKAVPRAGSEHEIRLENVCFRYDDAKEDAVKNISLTIRPGEKLALVGMNGAGKTTLVKMLCGLYRPSSGKIYLDGKDVTGFSREAYFKEFAVVFQDVFAFSFSLEDNVTCALPEQTDGERLVECLKKADLWEKAESLPKGIKTSMNKDLDEEGVTLSGGEMQRLMLARALYKDAPIVILDEPTAALDPIAESRMYEKYYEMTEHKTSIFISHRLSSTRFCDRILFMENGRITEEGNHDGLMEKQGAYANMFEVQAQYYKKKEKEEECYA